MTPTHKIARYGWKPDLPDHRDVMYTLERGIALPAKVDLRDGFPVCYDQGQLGSCTANSIAAAFEFGLRKQKIADFMPSRLFIYFNERAMEGTINQDAGAMIRDGIKSVNKLGVCKEKTWPYNTMMFTHKPSGNSYTEAKKNIATSYMRVLQDLNHLKTCLAEGYPFVFGFSVYDAFESDEVAKTGIVPMPSPKDKQLGGHAVCCVGYDDATKCFIVRNSWGSTWGQKGYFLIPYEYLTNPNLADDFWTIRLVS